VFSDPASLPTMPDNNGMALGPACWCGLLTTRVHSPLSCQRLCSQFTCEHCDKEYSTIHHLESHQRVSCNTSKRSISNLLVTTKEFWENRKRRRLEELSDSLAMVIDSVNTVQVPLVSKSVHKLGYNTHNKLVSQA
jgi:hypothetical protein